MEKFNGVSRIRAVLLVLVLVLVGFAGCGTAPQAGGDRSGGGNGAEEGGAARLARDLGKAANGDAVTLSGWAGLNTALVVPEGVTLDLTAEGTFLDLRDGAVLTVDGTVKARGHGDHGQGWVDGSLRIGDGTTTINGSGTINLKSKGRLLNLNARNSPRHLTLDGVTLAGVADNDASLVEVTEGAELILRSGAITGNTRVSDDWAVGGGVNVWKGTFTMEGGTVSGNSASGKEGAGGGVNVRKAAFTMTGGTISGNNVVVTGHGGGVNIGEESVFTMKGGTITGNTVQGDGSTGGGVSFQNASGSTFTMEGGTIYGNCMVENGSGGGVHASGTFIMKGGTIYGSSAEGGNANTSQANAALNLGGTAKWGTGGTYTKGGVPQRGGSDIGSTNDTLIAVPGK